MCGEPLVIVLLREVAICGVALLIGLALAGCFRGPR